MSLIDTDLASGVEESLVVCPQFRILVVGNTGVGKSSLVSSVFNIGLNAIDVAHGREGRASIEFGYTSNDNPRFILHDSQGFVPGSTANWDIVEKFLRDKCSPSVELKHRIHAIWLCIETPRTGSRVQQTGDEKLLSLAKELNVPILAVFTKFDTLVNERIRKARKAKTPESDARKEAEEDFEKRIQDFKTSTQVDCVWISTKPNYLSSLQRLAEVARYGLHEMEGELWLPWAAAQQISARQKVDQSIREGCKKYWINLGHSSVFQGQPLINCLSRIHDDILKVWNFHDPDNLLSGGYVLIKIIKGIQDFSPTSEVQTNRGDDDWLGKYSDIMTLANAIGTTVAQALGGVGIALLALKYLYRRYRAVEPTARYMGAFIIDLTLTLYKIFEMTLPKDPPRPVTQEIIDDTVEQYRMLDSAKVHRRIREITPAHFELQIGDLIRESLGRNYV